MPVKRKSLKCDKPWPVYGTLTKDGMFTALTGQKFNRNLAYPLPADFRHG
jgi:hypothetical protein